MLHYAAIFLVVAVSAIVLVLFGNILAGGAIFIAKVCFFIFIALFLGFLMMDLYHKKKRPS